MKLSSILTIDLFKTFWINFTTQCFKDAIHFPIIVVKRTKIQMKLNSGNIKFDCPIRPGLLVLGARGVGIIDNYYERTIWRVYGTVTIRGKVSIGAGSRISVATGAKMIFNGNFRLSARSSIVCEKEIVWGHNCLLSWDILVIDSDFHKILNENGLVVNSPSPIRIGNNIWIGCRSTILKGTSIADNVVIAAGSKITKNLDDSNSIYSSNGKDVNVLKSKISWEE